MKRQSAFILASTLILFSPSLALAQDYPEDRQCIYPSYRLNFQNRALSQNIATLSPAVPSPSVPSPSVPSPAVPSTLAQLNTPVTLDGKVSKSRKADKHPQALSLKFTDEQASRTLLPGSTFTIELENELSSNDAAVGDKVGAHLIQDLQIGDLLLAPKGAKLEGTVSSVYKACRGIKTNKVKGGHFKNANGGIQMAFNKLVNTDGTSYVISANPAAGADVLKQTTTEQKMAVNKHGEVGVPYRAKTYETISFAITTGSIAAGPFGFAAAPALCALIGGVCPSYGLGRPSKPGEKHTRVKGALMGALRGSPGGFLTSGLFVHGLEAKVSTGDRLIVQLSQPLTVTLPADKPVEKISSAVQ